MANDTANTITPALECHGLVKTFGRVVALDGVDFAVYPGEVLAVVGDNGAGKSTLVKCLSGVETPNEGVMRLHGQAFLFRNPTEARLAGVNAIHQTLAVQPALDIASNLFRDREPPKPGGWGKLMQMLEDNGIRKRKAFDSKVIILDEPTTALGARESVQVRKLIENLRGRGLPVVLVSHNMQRVYAVADRIHVQRLGKRVAVVTPRSANIADVLAIMSGAAQVDVNDQTQGPVR